MVLMVDDSTDSHNKFYHHHHPLELQMQHNWRLWLGTVLPYHKRRDRSSEVLQKGVTLSGKEKYAARMMLEVESFWREI